MSVLWFKKLFLVGDLPRWAMRCFRGVPYYTLGDLCGAYRIKNIPCMKSNYVCIKSHVGPLGNNTDTQKVDSPETWTTAERAVREQEEP